MRTWVLVGAVVFSQVLACGDGGGNGGSSGGGSGPTGGSATGGNAAASSGKAPASPLCDPFAAHVASACPDEWTVEYGRSECQGAFDLLYPQGCGTEWGTYVACTTQADIDCVTQTGIGCDPNVYANCVGAFVAQTGCSRQSAAVTCPQGQFIFACRSGIPTGCTEVETGGLQTIVCCPPFPD